MAESRMAILIPPVEPGYHSLTVDTHTHTLQVTSLHQPLIYRFSFSFSGGGVAAWLVALHSSPLLPYARFDAVLLSHA